MSPHLKFALTLPALLAVGACTTLPSGPSVLALPGSSKNFDQFRADDFDCRQFANAQVGGASANQAATDSAVKSAVVGTALGAAAGAAINGGQGAAVGAGIGLLMGAAAGSGAAQGSYYALQQRYDYAYLQCMYAKGDKVPVVGQFASQQPQAVAPTYYPPSTPPAAPTYYPPPPPPNP